MNHTITYSKIKHWYVRLKTDWTLKLSIPLKMKNNKEFEEILLEKWKILIEKSFKLKENKIETFWENYTVIFGEKITRTEITPLSSKLLKKLLEQESIPIIEKYTTLIWIPHNKLTIKDLKSKRWSCTRDQKIVLNLKLLHLPKIFLEYVIAHEVCHLKVKNHSHKFWNLVWLHFPNYKEVRKELKKYKI